MQLSTARERIHDYKQRLQQQADEAAAATAAAVADAATRTDDTVASLQVAMQSLESECADMRQKLRLVRDCVLQWRGVRGLL